MNKSEKPPKRLSLIHEAEGINEVVTKMYDWHQDKPDIRKACDCRGRGVICLRNGNGVLGPYVRCPCGRLPDSWGSTKLQQQAALEKRLEEVKKGNW